MGPTRTFSRGTYKEIKWLPTTISATCGEPKCPCHTARKNKPNICPALEGQVHLSGDTQYVLAVGKTFEAGGQTVKNREMRSLAQATYARHAVITSRIQSPTSEGTQLVLNLGQPVTQTVIHGRRGGALTDRRFGGVNTRNLHGRSRQQGGRRRCL